MAGEVLHRSSAQEESPLVSRSSRSKEPLVPLTTQPSTPDKACKHPTWHVPGFSWSLDFNPLVLHVAMLEAYFKFCGLEPRMVDIDSNTRMHCWVPSHSTPWHNALWCGGRQKESQGREAVLLLHGFGASAIWQWMHQIRALTSAGFDVYMPDLVFFGGSWSSLPERSEVFQAQSMGALMSALGVERFHVNGISYGGFIAYSLAILFPSRVRSLTLTNSGIMMTADEYQDMLSRWGVKDTAELLLPSDPEGVQRLMDLAYHHPPHPPHWLLEKTLPVLFSDMVQEKRELLEYLRKTTLGNNQDLPPPQMDTLLIWGAHDKVFPIAIAERMKRRFGDKARLAVLAESSHLSNAEQAPEYSAAFLTFLYQQGTRHSLLDCCRHCEPDWFLRLVHLKAMW